MWYDIMILLEMVGVAWAKAIGKVLSMFLILYWFLALLAFLFAIETYQHEPDWGKRAVIEAAIWPYSFYEQYYEKHHSYQPNIKCECGPDSILGE